MAGESKWRLLIPAQLRRLPADLTAVLLLTATTLLTVITPGIRETPLRVIFGLPFVLFLPGYALIAALFPEAGHTPDDAEDIEELESADEVAAEATERDGIDGIERVALSFGLSIAVVPLLGLVLNFTPFGIRLAPILVAISGFTVVMTAIAAHRRWQLAPEDQFHVPYNDWLQTAWSELTSPESRFDGALNVLLVVSILLAVTSVGYAVAVPKEGEAFTEQYLLTEQENGTLVADNYPTEFQAGETKPVIVGIGNHEHQDVTYSLVVELQDVQVQNNSTTVLDETELDRFQAQVAAGETHHQQYNITPDRPGTRLRLAFLLYKGEAPAEPTVESAYRETHLWVNVSNPQ